MPSRKPFNPSPKAIRSACTLPLHPEAEFGLSLFNQGKYFIAHEALENAWNAEKEPDRRLYQGILQAGIVYLHARNCYAKGVFLMYGRALRWLTPWPDHCRTINIGQIKADLRTLVEQVRGLGPDRLDELNPNLFTKILRV